MDIQTFANVGGKKRNGITRDERDHFLGHVEPGQTRWYTGDADETYLLPLVNLIGLEYSDGEAVGYPIPARQARSTFLGGKK